MRFFIDTEFNAEIGPNIELISIGIAAADGRNYYAVSSEFDPDKCSDWVKENVFPKLGEGPRSTLLEMRKDITAFVGKKPAQFWGYYAAWDWLLLGQHIMGGMMKLPANWREICMDVKQWQIQAGAPQYMGLPAHLAHNALNDAIWTMEYHEHLSIWGHENKNAV